VSKVTQNCKQPKQTDPDTIEADINLAKQI
jgi:hypothetical protein